MFTNRLLIVALVITGAIAAWGIIDTSSLAATSAYLVKVEFPIAAGYPMGLVVTRKEIAEKFERHSEFFSTTGGNPGDVIETL